MFVDAHAIPALAIFARAAIPGKTKTRLIPALGREGAAEFHCALVGDTLRKAAKLKGNIARYLFVAGGAIPAPRLFKCRKQRGRNLGGRLDHAFRLLLRRHPRVVVISTDTPAVTSAILRLALEELRAVDAVLGPCPDGGYYLIGLRRPGHGLFRDVRLGSEFAFDDTLGSLLAQGFSCAFLESFPDIDCPEDLRELRKGLVKNPQSQRLMPQTWHFLSRRTAFGN